MKYLWICLLVMTSAYAEDGFLSSVKRMNWKIGKEELDVVWIEDNKFPKFTASIFFQDGAISDPISGITQTVFDQLSAGTSKENQREISEFFDFYGAISATLSLMNIQFLLFRHLRKILSPL